MLVWSCTTPKNSNMRTGAGLNFDMLVLINRIEECTVKLWFEIKINGRKTYVEDY